MLLKPPCIPHIFEAPSKHSPRILFKSKFKDCIVSLARLKKTMHWYVWLQNIQQKPLFFSSWTKLRYRNTCFVLLISLVSSMMIEKILLPISVWTRSSIKSATICNNSFWIFQEVHCWCCLSCEFNLSCNHGISLHLMCKSSKKFPRLTSDDELISCQSSRCSFCAMFCCAVNTKHSIKTRGYSQFRWALPFVRYQVILLCRFSFVYFH